MQGEALWPRRLAPAALQCHDSHAGLAVVLYDIFGPHGRPSDATVAPGKLRLPRLASSGRTGGPPIPGEATAGPSRRRAAHSGG